MSATLARAIHAASSCRASSIPRSSSPSNAMRSGLTEPPRSQISVWPSGWRTKRYTETGQVLGSPKVSIPTGASSFRARTSQGGRAGCRCLRPGCGALRDVDRPAPLQGEALRWKPSMQVLNEDPSRRLNPSSRRFLATWETICPAKSPGQRAPAQAGTPRWALALADGPRPLPYGPTDPGPADACSGAGTEMKRLWRRQSVPSLLAFGRLYHGNRDRRPRAIPGRLQGRAQPA